MEKNLARRRKKNPGGSAPRDPAPASTTRHQESETESDDGTAPGNQPKFSGREIESNSALSHLSLGFFIGSLLSTAVVCFFALLIIHTYGKNVENIIETQPRRTEAPPKIPSSSNALDFDHHRSDVEDYFAPRAVPLMNMLTVQECQYIIQEAYKHELYDGEIKHFKGAVDNDESAVVKRTRVAKGVGLDKKKFDWLYRRHFESLTKLNDQYWKYKLPTEWTSDLYETMQLNVYEASEGGHYGWHHDLGVTGPMGKRRLSAVTMLDDPQTYEGGILQIRGNSQHTDLGNEQGSTHVFPSYMLHRVTPVTKGVRRTLALWVETSQP